MIAVLRLGHRISRDKRITTHCALTSRAFGADKMYYTGEKDESMEFSVADVVKRWGGNFKVEYVKNWKSVLKNTIVHLTMYGLELKKEIGAIRRHKNILIVIGGEKVPPEIYHLADYNISVGLQPHSEVAALSIFLHEYFKGAELGKEFSKGLKIVPQKEGKKVI